MPAPVAEAAALPAADPDALAVAAPVPVAVPAPEAEPAPLPMLPPPADSATSTQARPGRAGLLLQVQPNVTEAFVGVRCHATPHSWSLNALDPDWPTVDPSAAPTASAVVSPPGMPMQPMTALPSAAVVTPFGPVSAEASLL